LTASIHHELHDFCTRGFGWHFLEKIIDDLT